MEFITKCYRLREYPDTLQLIAVLQQVGHTLGIGRVEAHAFTLRGIIQHLLGLFYEALESYQKALSIYTQESYDPGRGTVLQRMGDTFLALLRYEQALSSFESVLQIAPNHIPSLLGKASALELLERDTEAMETFRRVLAVDPQNQQARRGLAGLGVT
jgi:tetratricopeptide (TPR) repeat protein